MAGFWCIEQEGEEPYEIVSVHDYYYRLGEKEVLRAQWEIGYCHDCDFIYWVEELRPYTAENSITSYAPMMTKEGDPDYEWDLGFYRGKLAYEARFNRFLECRTSPPRCITCAGSRVVSFDYKFDDLEHPTTKRRVRIVSSGIGVTRSQLEREFHFLSPEGEPLKLSEEEQKILAEAVEGSRR